MSNSKEQKVKYHGDKDKPVRKKNPNIADISKQGYGVDSSYNTLPYIDIDTPSGRIDMSNTGIPLWANGRILPPYSGLHQFDTTQVREIPLAQKGGWLNKYQGTEGGSETGKEIKYVIPYGKTDMLWNAGMTNRMQGDGDTLTIDTKGKKPLSESDFYEKLGSYIDSINTSDYTKKIIDELFNGDYAREYSTFVEAARMNAPLTSAETKDELTKLKKRYLMNLTEDVEPIRYVTRKHKDGTTFRIPVYREPSVNIPESYYPVPSTINNIDNWFKRLVNKDLTPDPVREAIGQAKQDVIDWWNNLTAEGATWFSGTPDPEPENQIVVRQDPTTGYILANLPVVDISSTPIQKTEIQSKLAPNPVPSVLDTTPGSSKTVQNDTIKYIWTSGGKISKEDFIKQYGQAEWDKATNQGRYKKKGGSSGWLDKYQTKGQVNLTQAALNQANSSFQPSSTSYTPSISGKQQHEVFTKRQDVGNISDEDFKKKYGEGKNRYMYRTDPAYKAAVDKDIQAKEAAGMPMIKKTVEVNPNLMFMAPNATNAEQAQNVIDYNLLVQGSMLPIPGLQAVGKVPGIFDAASGLLAASKESGLLSKLGRYKSVNVPAQLPGSPNFSPVINIANNLEDLQAAQTFAQQYGYQLPENLERVAQSNVLTDRVIRGMMNRHNTFVRGISTNWEELGKRNPEILRHLEGKGFDLSTKEGTKAAAEYMGTHVPINTGYGRASLNKEVFDEGMQGLYTSNSIPTAEGYTYGQGYIVKGKRPTDFSSLNRQDWISKNNLYYRDEDKIRALMYPLSEEAEEAVLFSKSKLWKPKYYDKKPLINPTPKDKAIREIEYRIDDIEKELEKVKKGDLVYVNHDKTLNEKTQTLAQLKEDIKHLEEHGDEILKTPKEYKILRTERSNIATDPYNFLFEKKGNAKNLSEFLKTQPYNEKMKEVHELGESLYKYTQKEQELIRDKIDILTKEATDSYNESIQTYMKANYPEYDPVNRYAHYIHVGTPGERILQPIKSWEITPDMWMNKSRGHSNKYSKKFSAMEIGGSKLPKHQTAPGETQGMPKMEVKFQGPDGTFYYDASGKQISQAYYNQLMKQYKGSKQESQDQFNEMLKNESYDEKRARDMGYSPGLAFGTMIEGSDKKQRDSVGPNSQEGLNLFAYTDAPLKDINPTVDRVANLEGWESRKTYTPDIPRSVMAGEWEKHMYGDKRPYWATLTEKYRYIPQRGAMINQFFEGPFKDYMHPTMSNPEVDKLILATKGEGPVELVGDTYMGKPLEIPNPKYDPQYRKDRWDNVRNTRDVQIRYGIDPYTGESKSYYHGSPSPDMNHVTKEYEYLIKQPGDPKPHFLKRSGGSKLPSHLPEAYKTGGWLKKYQPGGTKAIPFAGIPTQDDKKIVINNYSKDYDYVVEGDKIYSSPKNKNSWTDISDNKKAQYNLLSFINKNNYWGGYGDAEKNIFKAMSAPALAPTPERPVMTMSFADQAIANKRKAIEEQDRQMMARVEKPKGTVSAQELRTQAQRAAVSKQPTQAAQWQEYIDMRNGMALDKEREDYFKAAQQRLDSLGNKTIEQRKEKLIKDVLEQDALDKGISLLNTGIKDAKHIINNSVEGWTDAFHDLSQSIDDLYTVTNRGVKRKLTTYGIIEDNDIETTSTKESPVPKNINEYYSTANKSGSSVDGIFDAPYDRPEIKGRQFKQQTLNADAIKWGVRNRGDYKPFKSDGLEVTAFQPFTRAAHNDNVTVIAVDPSGKMHTGKYKDFKNQKDYVWSPTFMNKVTSIPVGKTGKGAYKKSTKNPNYLQPVVNVIDEKTGKEKQGSFNILVASPEKETYYGSVQGGRILFVNPKTKEKKLVAGNMEYIRDAFEKFKKDAPYLETYVLDNGTYSRGLAYDDREFNEARLRSYDNENQGGGGNGLYIMGYDEPVDRFPVDYMQTPNVRTEQDSSYILGHPLKNEIKKVILHHTAYENPKTNEQQVKNQYMTPRRPTWKPGVGTQADVATSHVVIEEDGKRTVYASPEQVTFHAGESEWEGRTNVNDFGIGVEFQGNTLKKPLTNAQIESFIEYYAPLAKKYNLNMKDIITHAMIATNRKTDHKYDIVDRDYKRVLNRLKELGYK